MNENLMIFLHRNLKDLFINNIIRFFLITLLSAGMTLADTEVTAQSGQGISIAGSVTDAASGEPLLGVNIVVQGTLIGTVTDLTGKYTISVPNEQSVLVFSFIGYQSQSVTVGSQRQINVLLKSEAAALEEVVVVGYGMQKKESVVGAISQATGEQIRQNIQGADLATGLTGAIPGLITLRTTGRPGGFDQRDNSGNATYPLGDDQPVQMFIRGQKTWNQASPLVLIDGVERDFRNINPYEIEKISILKDASATAVFGVKGANGVILITTQRGQEGKAKLTFDATTTFKTLSRIAKKENAYNANTFKNYTLLNELPINEAGWNRITPQRWVNYYKTHEYPEYFPDINWLDMTMKDFTVDQNVNMTATGGTKLVKYHTALSYLHESDLIDQGDIGQGYDPSFAFDRLNFRSNLDFDITPTTRFSTNLSGTYYKQRRSGGGNYAFRGIYGTPPDVWPNKYRDGTYAEDIQVINATNVLWEWNYSGYQLVKGVSVNTDFILNQKLDFITKGLSANAKFSYDNESKTTGPNVGSALPMTKFINPIIVDDPLFSQDLKDPELAALEEKYTTWNIETGGTDGYDWTLSPNSYGSESVNLNVYRSTMYEFSLNYNREFGKHTVSGLGLMSRQIRASGSVFPSYREDWVGRVTYAYDRRYFLEANGAYNGSEKFAEKYRFGFFPSVAVGWTISNEAFFEPLKSVVNNLKIRYSDGIVGSDAGIERWLYTSSWVVQPSASGMAAFVFGAPYLQYAYPFRHEGTIPNQDIQWETSHKKDLGIETTFFENQIKVNFDYFIENRTNIFVTGSDRSIPDYFGAQPVSANIGKVDVHGWEIEAQASHTFASGFNIWTSYAWAFAKDKILERGDPILKPDYQKLAGYQISQPRVTLNQGKHSVMNSWNDVYNCVGPTTNLTMLLPGDFMRVDYNCDGIIDSNDAVPYGYPTRPQYSYAPSFGMSYKSISANVRFYGVYNIEGGVTEGYGFYPELEDNVISYTMANAWCVERNNTTNALYPAQRFQTTAAGGYVDRPRSYLRLESAEISYSLNSATVPLIQKAGLKSIRFILSGNNLILWSKMLTDKDYQGESTVETRTNYPVLKRYNVGVSIDF